MSRSRRTRLCDCGLASRAFAAEVVLPFFGRPLGVLEGWGGKGPSLARRGVG